MVHGVDHEVRIGSTRAGREPNFGRDRSATAQRGEAVHELSRLTIQTDEDEALDRIGNEWHTRILICR
jgi:hypothetical protein